MQLYPRWKVSLLLRLEEFGANGELLRYARSQPPVNDTKSGTNAPLKAVQDQDAQQRGIRRWVITKQNSAATTPNMQAPSATQGVPAVPKPTTSPNPVVNPKDPKYKQATSNGPSVQQLGDDYRSGKSSPEEYLQGLDDHYNKGEVFQP